MKHGRFEESKKDVRHSVESKNDKQTDPVRNILSYLHDFVFLLSGILLVLLLLFRVVVVSGPSMRNTLIDGDYIILMNNILYREPQHGDIIVASKQTFKNGEPIIKRVIAKEGQEVNINFETGVVFVDGIELEEEYTLTPTNQFEGMTFPLIVDKGCVFVMGDNRNGSKDSRDPEIGLIDYREILGKAIFLALPGIDKTTETRDLSRIGGLS